MSLLVSHVAYTDFIVWIAVGVGAGLSIVFLGCGVVFCCCLGRRSAVGNRGVAITSLRL